MFSVFVLCRPGWWFMFPTNEVLSKSSTNQIWIVVLYERQVWSQPGFTGEKGNARSWKLWRSMARCVFADSISEQIMCHICEKVEWFMIYWHSRCCTHQLYYHICNVIITLHCFVWGSVSSLLLNGYFLFCFLFVFVMNCVYSFIVWI